MKKGWISMGVLVGFLFATLLATGVLAADVKDVVEFKGGAQGKVTFTHKKHAETLKIDCLKCHHTWKKGETSGKLCKDCHKQKAEGKTLSLEDSMHKDCRGCHSEAKKANKPAGPTVCSKCHVKAAKK